MTYPDPQSPYPQTERGWSSAHLVLMPTKVASRSGNTTPPNGCWSARRSTAMLQVTKLVYPSQFQMMENGWPLDRARMKTAQAAFGHTPLWRIRHRRHRQVHRRHRQVHLHLHHRVHRRLFLHHRVHRHRVHRHQVHRRLFHRRRRPVHHHPVPRPVRHLQQIQHHRRHHRRTHPVVRISM